MPSGVGWVGQILQRMWTLGVSKLVEECSCWFLQVSGYPRWGCIGLGKKWHLPTLLFLKKFLLDPVLSAHVLRLVNKSSYNQIQMAFQTSLSTLYLFGVVCYAISVRVGTQFLYQLSQS